MQKNAINGNDRNVYVDDDKGLPTSEVIAQTLRPYDFLFTRDDTGIFLYDEKICGRTFSIKDMKVTGSIRLSNGNIEKITNADFWALEQWGNQIYVKELKRADPKTVYGYLEVLRDLSRNDNPLDFKVSLGAERYTVLKVGLSTDGTNVPLITSLRAAGNFVFGSNMRLTEKQFPLIPTDIFYGIVMRKVGEYNQEHNNGNGYNAGHPYFGEHTYSGSYIYHGYYGKFYD
jgi:hypothetical protein